jgi:hypothetical protein
MFPNQWLTLVHRILPLAVDYQDRTQPAFQNSKSIFACSLLRSSLWTTVPKAWEKSNKKEIPCCHGNREHIFWLFVSWQKEKLLVGSYSVSIFWSTEHYHGILVFWDFGRIMVIKPMEHRGSKLGSMGFFNNSIKFLIERVPSLRIFEFWDFGWIASRPQAQMIMSLKLNMIFTLRPFKRAIICPNLIAGTWVILVKLDFSW